MIRRLRAWWSRPPVRALATPWTVETGRRGALLLRFHLPRGRRLSVTLHKGAAVAFARDVIDAVELE